MPSTIERLVKLERLTLPRDGEGAGIRVCFIGLSGFSAPSGCEDLLLAQDELEHPGEHVRFVRLFEPDGRCLACGQYHHVGEPSN